MTRLPLVLAVSLLSTLTLLAQVAPLPPPPPGVAVQQPPRDVSLQARTGTARIRGRVLAAQNNQPLRRTQVTLIGQGFNRRTTTDTEGRYEFAAVPAGTFSLSASRPGYVTLSFGQRRPLEPGTPVVVADGQVLERIDLRLPRGGVIAVRVTDDFGEPVVGAQVQVHRYQYNQEGQRRLTPVSGGGANITDDRGEQRSFGLQPGDYVVSAIVRTQGIGTPGSTTDTVEGFAPTFYPGTPNVDQAQTVTLGAGEELTVPLALIAARLSRISGSVHDSQGRPASNVMLQVSTTQGIGLPAIGVAPVSADGSFNVGGVPPGDYLIQVRPMPRPGPDGTVMSGEVASVPVAVNGADVTNLQIVTRRGAMVSGRVVFDGGTPSNLPTPLRVMLQQSDPLAGFLLLPNPDPARNGVVDADGRFRLPDAGGRVFFQVSAPRWVVKSVTLEGRDITDLPLDLTNAASADVLITMTSKPASIAGQVIDGRGEALKAYVVVIVPIDPIEPAAAGRLTRVLRGSQATGKFQFRGIRPGRYVAAAVDWLEEGRQFSPEFQLQLRRVGQTFTVREGETVTLDLRLSEL